MARKNFNPIEVVANDGLIIPDVGAWAEKKYKLVGGYCDIFTAGMRKKWDTLVYIDLFAGAGFAKIKGSNKILKSSALIALSIPTPFDKYIFCEADEEKLEALKKRVEREYPNADVEYILGDSNENINHIISFIPKGRYGIENVLRFCFVDPFSLNLKFETIRQLSKVGKIDFLILLALHMDANRNFVYYINENSNKIDDFIGDNNWRTDFQTGQIRSQDFILFLSERYDANMQALKYVEPVTKHQVKIEDKNIPLYYLAFYSQHPRGNDFFKKVEKYQTSQQTLF